jgi:putative addiction module component (TIGR02574 family)
MTTLVDELSQRARALSPEDRARLAECLLDSLDVPGEPASKVDAAWEAEIRLRVEEIQAGRANFSTADEVHAQTRRLYRK